MKNYIITPATKLNNPVLSVGSPIKKVVPTKPIFSVLPHNPVNDPVKPINSGYHPFVNSNGLTPIDHPSNFGINNPVLTVGNPIKKVVPVKPAFSVLPHKPINEPVKPVNNGYHPFVNSNGLTPIDHPSNFGTNNPVLTVDNPIKKAIISFGNGVTINGIYYPDQPPLGYYKKLIKNPIKMPIFDGINKKITITGRVVDKNNLPIPFVSVFLEKDNSIGTTTDNNGNYAIDANIGDNVIFSFASYSQAFEASSIPKILKLSPNALPTVDLGTVIKPKTAGFGLVTGLLLAGLFFGNLLKKEKKSDKSLFKKTTILDKSSKKRKPRTVTI